MSQGVIHSLGQQGKVLKMNQIEVQKYLVETNRTFVEPAGDRCRFDIAGGYTLSRRPCAGGGLQKSHQKDIRRDAEQQSYWLLTTPTGQLHHVQTTDDLDRLLPPTASSLHRELEQELGATEAGELLRLLKSRDRSEKPADWRRELLEVYERPGVAAPRDVAADHLRLHAQHLRQELGAKPRTFVNNDAWKLLHATVAEFAKYAGKDVRRAQAHARARLSARLGLDSTTHAPPTLFEEGVNRELLRLYLAQGKGEEAVLVAIDRDPDPPLWLRREKLKPMRRPAPLAPTSPDKRKKPKTYTTDAGQRIWLLSEIATRAGVSLDDAEGVSLMLPGPDLLRVNVEGNEVLALPVLRGQRLLRESVKWRLAQPGQERSRRSWPTRGQVGSTKRQREFTARQQRDLEAFNGRRN